MVTKTFDWHVPAPVLLRLPPSCRQVAFPPIACDRIRCNASLPFPVHLGRFRPLFPRPLVLRDIVSNFPPGWALVQPVFLHNTKPPPPAMHLASHLRQGHCSKSERRAVYMTHNIQHRPTRRSFKRSCTLYFTFDRGRDGWAGTSHHHQGNQKSANLWLALLSTLLSRIPQQLRGSLSAPSAACSKHSL